MEKCIPHNMKTEINLSKCGCGNPPEQSGNILIDQAGEVLADMGVTAAMARLHSHHLRSAGEGRPLPQLLEGAHLGEIFDSFAWSGDAVHRQVRSTRHGLGGHQSLTVIRITAITAALPGGRPNSRAGPAYFLRAD